MTTFRRWLTGRTYQPPYPPIFAGLADIKAQLSAMSTNSDDRLETCARGASAFFASETRRTFEPYDAVWQYDWTAKKRLVLDDDLLVLDSVSDFSGTIPSSDYALLPGHRAPYSAVQLLGTREFKYNTNAGRTNAISVSGTWGYHDNPVAMWQDATTLSAAVDDAVILIPVNALPADVVLRLIKVGDEYMRVLDTQTSPSAGLIVQRGVNGSTAAAHAEDAPVAVFQPNAEIVRAVSTIALYLYETKDNFGTVYAAADGVVEVARTLPGYVYDTIVSYRSGRKR